MTILNQRGDDVEKRDFFVSDAGHPIVDGKRFA
jgi:hypothetical protein